MQGATSHTPERSGKARAPRGGARAADSMSRPSDTSDQAAPVMRHNKHCSIFISAIYLWKFHPTAIISSLIF